MPGKLKVKVVAGRDLPVMDRSSDLTDAFVEVEDEALQDEPLELRYCQNFDLEGESGIVVRGIGTAVTLCKPLAPPSPLGISPLLKE
ncbi:hypothetical protein KUTeg_023357 [Tegillarca granosa]|uniref:Uncharacterized protein n=1 Tax=Tegillarca granosa TaxID=220873 RepID=A0ABQ9E5Z6_TEGGR|nr:hypothetical protein KUTeg_023357 [Tegillarca granosa]